MKSSSLAAKVRNGLMAVALLSSAALAQTGPLSISASGFNGAEDGPSEPDYDGAIRVVVTLDNLQPGVVNVTSIKGTFFDGEGKKVYQDSADPIVLYTRETKEAYLYFANPASIYAYKVDGEVDYTANGKTYTQTFVVSELDTTSTPPRTQSP